MCGDVATSTARVPGTAIVAGYYIWLVFIPAFPISPLFLDVFSTRLMCIVVADLFRVYLVVAPFLVTCVVLSGIAFPLWSSVALVTGSVHDVTAGFMATRGYIYMVFIDY